MEKENIANKFMIKELLNRSKQIKITLINIIIKESERKRFRHFPDRRF